MEMMTDEYSYGPILLAVRVPLLLLLATVIATGCDSVLPFTGDNIDQDTVSVVTDEQTYQPEEQVEVTIINGSTRAVVFSPCYTTLERKNGEWTQVDGTVCAASTGTPQKVRIDAGEKHTDELVWFNGDLTAEGPYRFVLGIANDSDELLPAPRRTTRAVSIAK